MTDFKRKRLLLRMSGSDLARKARVSRWRLGAAERGDIELTPQEMEQIQQALRREAARLQTLSQELNSERLEELPRAAGLPFRETFLEIE
jgi:hypothetical protein